MNKVIKILDSLKIGKKNITTSDIASLTDKEKNRICYNYRDICKRNNIKYSKILSQYINNSICIGWHIVYCMKFDEKVYVDIFIWQKDNVTKEDTYYEYKKKMKAGCVVDFYKSIKKIHSDRNSIYSLDARIYVKRMNKFEKWLKNDTV